MEEIKVIPPDAKRYAQGHLYALYYVNRRENPFVITEVRGNLNRFVASCTSEEATQAALRLLTMDV